MKKTCFSIEQIVAKLKEAELGVPIAGVIRKVGIRDADPLSMEEAVRWYRDRSGPSAKQTSEGENSRLKQLVDDLSWIKRCCSL